MKKMSYWGKPVALFAIAAIAVGSLQTPAPAVPSTTTANPLEESKTASLQAQGTPAPAQGTPAPAQGTPAPAQDTPAQPAAPGVGLVGQCRAAKDRIFVYSQRSTSSPTLRTLALNERVTLADNGSGGWIAISAPATGYVQAASLKLCQGQTNPDGNTGANLCRVANVGLVVRQGPGGSTPVVGSVNAQQTVRLTNPPQAQVDTTGRTWISITTPRTGWVSSGFPEGNLGARFSCR